MCPPTVYRICNPPLWTLTVSIPCSIGNPVFATAGRLRMPLGLIYSMTETSSTRRLFIISSFIYFHFARLVSCLTFHSSNRCVSGVSCPAIQYPFSMPWSPFGFLTCCSKYHSFNCLSLRCSVFVVATCRASYRFITSDGRYQMSVVVLTALYSSVTDMLLLYAG